MSGAITAGDRLKVRPSHLERLAFVYVRQSSLRQVRNNLESQRLQYGFVDQALALGWSRERIVVIDEDQGKSASLPHLRAGFGTIVTAAARGEAGIVMSFELSRLSRNDLDWHQLVYLCRWTDSLIADEHGLYDPSTVTDRLTLGIRGQINELERDNIVHRMVEARWNKARRGEFFTIPPAGYEHDEAGQIQLSPDETVQAAVRRVFDTFDRLGTARQVHLWWRDAGLPFPVRSKLPRSHPIVWVPVCSRHIYAVLRHPIYAGAFVFGRTQTRRELDPETRTIVVHRGLRRDVDRGRGIWPVLIQDHHSAYISFDKYLENQRRMRDNSIMGAATDESHKGAPREGRALLQGLLRCGHCGRRMYVNYGGQKITRTLQYRCSYSRALLGKECQLVGGRRIEATVVDAFLQATESAGLEAADLAGEKLREEIAATERSWRLQLEKAEYEAQRAERQYMAIEPENRTVARELERRWNERLEQVEAVRAQAARAASTRQPLTDEELARARELGRDLEAAWNAETTTMRDRKRLLRALIDEVQLRTEQNRHLVRIVWKGGAATDRELPRVRPGDFARTHATSEDVVELVRRLAGEFDDAQIARVLNRQGRRSGLGLTFTRSSVSSLRHKNQIPVCPRKKPRDERDGPFTADEAALQLGVSMHTVHRWLRQGVLAGEQAAPAAPWRILLTEEVRLRLKAGDAPADWVGLSEAARRLGLSKPLVAHMVKTGKLPAVRTVVGKRPCWRIDVSSATCGRQTDIFDQVSTGDSKES
ncbi:MAG: recombinase family protein [Myxococcota bacterium]|nr:recombinase family protein [Myxococcota bacterium]